MNSEITPVLERIKGTEEYDILVETESAYRRIETAQQEWYSKSNFRCPEGCGRCCEHFEPDLLENEALYMAAWLISNKPEWAENVSRETSADREQRESSLSHCRGPGVGHEVPNTTSVADNKLAFFHLTPDGCRAAAEGDRPNMSAGDSFEPFSREEGCPFFDPDSPRHCTIYNGRASICRLFGASGFRDKFGNEVWKPCKFYPAELLEKHNPPLAHRQYSVEEIRKAFGTFPPVMSDLMEQEETFTPDDDQTRLIRDTLPERIRHLMWIIELSSGKDIH
ncbi:MAG: YkgJ family cysteine cluster protein [Fibrobacter sp.]|nr:YkgJ family cysteine cluster protein [Fibrobacter sp.]